MNCGNARSKRTVDAAVTAAVGAVLLFAATSAQAAFFNFDPDGAGPLPGTTIGGLDPGPGTVLAQNAVTTAAGAPVSVGDTIRVNYQATLAGVINTSGITVGPAGLNTTFQITVQASLLEVITSINAVTGTDTFALAADQSASFINFYYNPSVVANPLAGTGFDAGTLILSARPNAAFSNSANFTANGDTAPFDGFGNDDYPGILSLVGAGSATLGGDVISFDPSFFLTPPTVLSINFNTSDVTPFNQTDPGQLVVGQVPNIGAVNGFSGPDFEFQADSNASFDVPEPASLGLLAVGAMGLLLRRRSRA